MFVDETAHPADRFLLRIVAPFIDDGFRRVSVKITTVRCAVASPPELAVVEHLETAPGVDRQLFLEAFRLRMTSSLNGWSNSCSSSGFLKHDFTVVKGESAI